MSSYYSGRKDSEVFIDGALCPSRAQNVLKALHLPLERAILSSKQSLQLMLMSRGGWGKAGRLN